MRNKYNLNYLDKPKKGVTGQKKKKNWRMSADRSLLNSKRPERCFSVARRREGAVCTIGHWMAATHHKRAPPRRSFHCGLAKKLNRVNTSRHARDARRPSPLYIPSQPFTAARGRSRTANRPEPRDVKPRTSIRFSVTSAPRVDAGIQPL